MFDVSWSELVLIGVIALIVIGPKELPSVLRAVGHWSAKIRRMAAEFQGQFQEAMREAEMADLKKQVDEINDSARSIGRFDPLTYDPAKTAAAPPQAAPPQAAPPHASASEHAAASGDAGAAVPTAGIAAPATELGQPPAPVGGPSEPAGEAAAAATPEPEQLGTGNRPA